MPETDFEAPLARAAEAHRRARRAFPGTPDKEQEARRLREELEPSAARGLREAHALAEDAGRPPPQPALHPRLRPGPVHRLDRDPRRPALRRRSRARVRLRALQGPARGRGRPPEGPRHEAEDLPQLRHAQARGLPQGAAGDAARREVRAARSSPSWTRRAPIPGSTPRSAARPRPSPSTCARWPRLRTPDHRDRDRRRRQRRRARHRGGRPRQHARALGLLRDLPRGLRLDPLARRRAGRGGGHGHEDHGPRPAALGHRRRDRPRAAGRRPREPRGARSRASTRSSSASSASCPAARRATLSWRRATAKFRKMGRLGASSVEARA